MSHGLHALVVCAYGCMCACSIHNAFPRRVRRDSDCVRAASRAAYQWCVPFLVDSPCPPEPVSLQSLSHLHVSPCFAATMRFGTSSRDAAAIKSSTPGPAYVPESTIGAEAPAFSFGKVCVVCVVYAYMCACVCVCVYSQDMFECVGTCAWACCPFRRECFDEGVTSAFPSLACGLARSSGDRVRYRPAC